MVGIYVVREHPGGDSIHINGHWVYMDGYIQDTMYYVHQDRLGSYAVITDDTGQVKQRLGYDVWGNRVLDTNWTVRAEFDNGDFDYIFRRGFTGHEHLGSFGIINMNGRIYDPNIASFFSPDPYVVDATSTQAFNRYSYCLNNPLMYTDPSGEYIHIIIGAAIGGIVNWAANGAELTWKGLGYFGIGALAGGLAAGVGAGVTSSLLGNGFTTGFLNGAASASLGFTNGFLVGGATGFTNGFITGFGNTFVADSKNNIGQALSKGALGGLIQGSTGGLTNGIINGIGSEMDGRRFWDGAKLINEETITPSYNLKYIPQDGKNNCLPACVETIEDSFGGSIDQTTIRSISGGGNKNLVSLKDADVLRSYEKLTGRLLDYQHTSLNSENVANVLSDRMQGGARILLNVNSGSDGHAVVLNQIVKKQYQSISGKLFYENIYKVVDPAVGFVRIPQSSIINAKNIFYIWR